MTETITVGRATDPERYLASDYLVWFQEVGSQSTELQLRGVPEDQRFAADRPGAEVDPATYPGVYGVRPMQLGIPGGSVIPVAGLTWVGVHPDHRRRGLLTAMMRHHFEQARSEGVHVSALHASEPAIYGRHGYGLASLELEVTLGRGTTFTAPHLDTSGITTRLCTITDPGMAERMRAMDLALAERAVGTIVAAQGFYDQICDTPPEELRDNEEWRVLIARADGQDVGWTAFRRKHKWENARPSATLSAFRLHAQGAARLELVRRLVDLDLVGSVKIPGIAQDDPLLLWLAGPRATGELQTYDSLWVRLVDLPEALAARSYEGSCDVVVDVADASAPWNAGRWRITVADGSASVTSTSDEAEVALPIEALGAAYLGGGNLASAARAGVIQELRPGAATELWRAFRTDVPPDASMGF
jgi:GNAT superfamily N-acetyltransferase